MKHRVQTYIVVEYHDLDDFITKHFAFPREKNSSDEYRPEPEGGVYLKEFEFVAIEEASNYSAYTYDVDGGYEWDKKEMKEMLEKKEFDMYSTRRILDYLANEGVIGTGTYLINVSW